MYSSRYSALFPTLWDRQSTNENHMQVDCQGEEQVARGLRTLQRTRRVGSGVASWARILEKGLTHVELVEMKTNVRARGTRRVGWGTITTHRRCCRDGFCTTIVGLFRWRKSSCTQLGCHPGCGWHVRQQLKPRDGSSIVGTVTMRSRWGIRNRTA